MKKANNYKISKKVGIIFILKKSKNINNIVINYFYKYK